MDTDQQNNVSPESTLPPNNVSVSTPSPKKSINKIIVVAVILLLLMVGAVSVLAYRYYKSDVEPAGSFQHFAEQPTKVLKDIDKVEIKYIDVKAKLLTAAQGHYISGENLYSTNPTLYYDGNPIIDKTMLSKNTYISGQSLSENGLHYAFTIGHYPHYPMTPQTNTQDYYIDGKKIESAHGPIPPLVSNTGEATKIIPKTTNLPETGHYLFWGEIKGWTLDGKPIALEGDNIPYREGFYVSGKGSVKMEGDTIYVYKADKTYIDAGEKPQMPANTFNGLDDNISAILDVVERTGNKNTEVQFKGKLVNNSDWQEIYLNGIGANLSSSELVFNSSKFFILPPKLESAQVLSGELFSVYFSAVALPGDYEGSVNIQAGFTSDAYETTVYIPISLHVK